MSDAAALRLVTASAPGQVFLGGGRAVVPHAVRARQHLVGPADAALGWQLAAGTLRVLAACQGTRLDPETGEQPGKIMHELRGRSAASGAVGLPPLYYGTDRRHPAVDLPAARRLALGHARRPRCAALLPSSRRPRWTGCATTATPTATGSWSTSTTPAAAWPTRAGRTPATPSSSRDGAIAEPPIALCEVQGYAYEAAVRGADLLEAFGRAGRGAVAGLGRAAGGAFRAAFWVDRRRRPATRRSPSTAPSARSTRSPATSATCSAPAC